MASKQTQKVLRIGVIQNERIIDEALITESRAVNVGSMFSTKNDVVVPVSGLPKSHTLFDFQKGKYVLRFQTEWKGKVSIPGKVGTLEQLVSGGQAKRKGSEAALPLTPSSRGKIKIGDVTILFQFVTPPPPKAKPVLPESMRGGWVKGVEPLLLMMIALSAVLQVGTVVWLENTDFPVPEQQAMMVEDRFVRLMGAEPEEEEPEETEEPEAKDEEAEEGEGEPEEQEELDPTPRPDPQPQETAEPDKDPSEMSVEERAEAEAASRVRASQNVDNSAVFGALGALSADGQGSITDALGGKASKESIDEAFAGTTRAKHNVRGEDDGVGSAGSSDADGTGGTTGIGGLGPGDSASAAENAAVETEERQQVAVKANIRGGEQQQVGMGTLDQASVSGVIRRRQSAIQNCYERVLKQNPEAGGKLVLQFTIGSRGRVTSTKVVSDISGGSVGGCASRAVKRWRFPRPKGGDVTVSKTFVLEAS